MDSKEMIIKRRSIRKYTDEFVPKDIIDSIMEETKFTQSWANSQPARFTIVQNTDMISTFAKNGVKGFVYNINTLKNAKNVAVLSYVKGKSGNLGNHKDLSDKWSMFDSGIACQTFTLSAFAHGIGTCVMGVIDEEIIAKEIDLPEDEVVAAIITFGFPAEDGKATSRLPVCEITRYID